MRIVLQRVSRARVAIDGEVVASIGNGVLLLVGIHRDDTAEAAGFLAAKCASVRIFPDAEGKMNLSLGEVNGEALAVSQFTLLADCGRGRRPSFIDAAGPEKGKDLYELFVSELGKLVPKVETGVFGAMMEVELVNDGPVTLILEK
ncbi:MAG: D-tyrosyl-tRNA(Tyr) deacylase [Chitinispirillaceae bacterium]|nr:D-tyrosyl-tRNA(Tyr) deacylase [Chitinispirillaceae bacterium]